MHITIALTGTTPLLQHNPQMVDPECDINIQLKAITSKRTRTEKDRVQMAKLEWYGGIYLSNGVDVTATTTDVADLSAGAGAYVVEPTAKVRKCLINTARIFKMGKMVERAISFSSLYVPLVHDGPRDINKLFATPRFHSRLSVGVGTKRIMRVRPQFFPWALSVSGLFIEDTGLNFTDLVRIVDMAGLAEGIGDNRVNGYGRFTAMVTTS